MDHTVSSHRTSADDDSLFLAATFSTSQHRNTSCKLLVTEHPLHSSPNMRLQCHDSLTLFHVSQPPSYRCPAIQTHHPYVSLPAVIAVCHHSMSSSLQLCQRSLSTSSSLQIINTQLCRNHLCNIATSSSTLNGPPPTFNCYLPHAGLLITDCRTIPLKDHHHRHHSQHASQHYLSSHLQPRPVLLSTANITSSMQVTCTATLSSCIVPWKSMLSFTKLFTGRGVL